MKTRWHLSLLLTLSLLWQGLAAAAVVPMLPVPAAAAEAAQPTTAENEAARASDMSEHCRMAGMHHGMQANAKTKAKTVAVHAAAAKAKTMSCCDKGSHCAGHCLCAMAAAGLSGLPMSAALLSLPPPTLLRSGFAQPPPGALPPLDPLRPPISVVL